MCILLANHDIGSLKFPKYAARFVHIRKQLYIYALYVLYMEMYYIYIYRYVYV